MSHHMEPKKIGDSVPSTCDVQKAKEKLDTHRGPKIVRSNVRIALGEFCLSPVESGWRDVDTSRISELKTLFRSGGYGQSVFAPPKLLCIDGKPKLSVDGLRVVDDGLSTVCACSELAEEHKANAEEFAWPQSLLDIFAKGLPIDEAEYPVDDRDVRVSWNAMVHDEESNRYSPTSIAMKVEVATKMQKKVPGGDWVAVKKELGLIFGKARVSTIDRWIRAARSLEPAVLSKLDERRHLKCSYIFDNPYFTAVGVKQTMRLSPEYKVHALHLLYDDLDGDQGVSVKQFVESYCKTMKYAELWVRKQHRSFGEVAAKSLGFQRVCAFLRSGPGRGQLNSCLRQGVPLDGTSEENPGIQECRQILQELRRNMTTPKEVESQVGDSVPPSDASKPDPMSGLQFESWPMEDAMMTSMSKPVEQSAAVPPHVLQAQRQAQGSLDRMQFFETEQALLQELPRKLSAKQRAIFVVEAPTSRQKTHIGWLELVNDVLKGSQMTTCTILGLASTRLDLLAASHMKGTALWPTACHYVVMLTAGDKQTAQQKPRYVHVVVIGDDHGSTMVSALPILKCNSRPIEGTRLRCLEKGCPLRSTPAKEGGPADTSEEINAEDKEVDALQDAINEDVAADEDFDEGELEASLEQVGMGECPCAKRDYVIDLFPFAQSMSFYTRLLQDVGSMATSQKVIILSATAHPSSWLSASAAGAEAWILRDGSLEQEGLGRVAGRAEGQQSSTCSPSPRGGDCVPLHVGGRGGERGSVEA